MEPEHSQKYTLQGIDFLAPQIFGQKSVVFDERLNILQVYYKEESQMIINFKSQTKHTFTPIEKVVSAEMLENLDMTFAQANSWFDDDSESQIRKQNFKQFDAICLGGTFDHMHSGHKILLTQASLLTKRRMLIGVTSSALL